MRILFANNNATYTSKKGLKLLLGGLIFIINDKVQVFPGKVWDFHLYISHT